MKNIPKKSKSQQFISSQKRTGRSKMKTDKRSPFRSPFKFSERTNWKLVSQEFTGELESQGFNRWFVQKIFQKNQKPTIHQ